MSEGNDSAPIETLEVLARIVERSQLRPDTTGPPGLSEAQQGEQAERDKADLHSDKYLLQFPLSKSFGKNVG